MSHSSRRMSKLISILIISIKDKNLVSVHRIILLKYVEKV